MCDGLEVKGLTVEGLHRMCLPQLLLYINISNGASCWITMYDTAVVTDPLVLDTGVTDSRPLGPGAPSSPVDIVKNTKRNSSNFKTILHQNMTGTDYYILSDIYS